MGHRRRTKYRVCIEPSEEALHFFYKDTGLLPCFSSSMTIGGDKQMTLMSRKLD